ncbi:MAG: glucokinase [Porticoccaceae bacterium]|nr:glucokinase [Porticoccaceae bacterium]MDG2117226.1 glucokinase [Porticoccaceae bacterium]
MADKWNLVADIGGTNARFSALLDNGSLESDYEFHHSVEEYPRFADLIDGLLAEIAAATGWSNAPTNVCFAVACPADSEEITFTNSHWQFTKTQLQQLLGCETLSVINDFEAVAHGITELDDTDLVKVGGADAVQTKPIGILGAGTGLGVAGLVQHADGYHVIDTEGGHADYAPIDDIQSAVVNCLRERYGRVSLERLLSGKGILNIYTALCSIEAVEAEFSRPADVVAAALAGTDSRALQTLDMFCEGMGSAAGNLALTLGAKGGVYIAGGVIPRFQEFFINSGFRSKFEDKGRFVSYLQPIPVFIVVRGNLGLLGAAKKLQQI